MAAIFQDGHNGLHWITTLCLEVAEDRQVTHLYDNMDDIDQKLIYFQSRMDISH